MPAPRHTNTPVCELCEIKLKEVDPRLATFAKDFRLNHVKAHISWGYRGRADQEKFLKLKTTKAGYGESPHNYGLALDFFTISTTGQALWETDFFVRELGPAALKAGLVWGGSWKSFKDLPHVELPAWKALVESLGLKLA